MEELKFGDVCKVINEKLVYTWYDRFAFDAGHNDINTNKYVKAGCESIVYGKHFRVLYTAPHGVKPNITIAIVETMNTPIYLKFMIDVKGLLGPSYYKGIAEGKRRRDCFLEDYSFGKLLTKKIPDEYVNELLIQTIIGKNPMDIQYVSPWLLTDEHYKNVLSKDGGLLGLISIERRNLLLCKIAILEEPYAEKFVPEELKSLVNN